ncbi:MAG: MotA/TolQ/ExbB proton channel family protein [Lentisphaerota bacterium]
MRIALLLGLAVAAIAMTVPWQSLRAQEAGAKPDAAVITAPAPAAADAGGAIVPPPAKSHSSGGLITIIWKSGWFGVMIWLMLLACLIVAVGLIVDSYLSIREKQISPASVVENVRTAIEQGDLIKAMDYCRHNPGPLSKILLAGFGNVEEGFEVIQDSVAVAADIEGEKLLSRVTYLSVISNTTPMLGLIGTVQGMIFAFATLGTTQAGAAQQAMLALNISHGLWATAVGLSTAVPATIYFFYFKNKATKIILGMEALTLDIIKSLRNVQVVEN